MRLIKVGRWEPDKQKRREQIEPAAHCREWGALETKCRGGLEGENARCYDIHAQGYDYNAVTLLQCQCIQAASQSSSCIEMMHKFVLSERRELLEGSSSRAPCKCQSINQFTFYVFGTHQGSQQTITGKTVYTNCSRRSTIEHQRCDAVMKEGASTATPNALH